MCSDMAKQLDVQALIGLISSWSEGAISGLVKGEQGISGWGQGKIHGKIRKACWK